MTISELRSEQLVELPSRLETSSAWFSPVTVTTTQSALALNAVNFGGSQTAVAHNVSITAIEVGG